MIYVRMQSSDGPGGSDGLKADRAGKSFATGRSRRAYDEGGVRSHPIVVDFHLERRGGQGGMSLDAAYGAARLEPARFV
jgi:hypothetical protein